MKKPVLSIVIPTLNEEKFVGVLINSILKNNYTPYEIIISDSGSSDRTKQIVNGYLKVKFTSVCKSGVSAARNKGANLAQGDYILFLDADTKISETFIKDSLEEMKRRKLDIGGFYITPLNGNLNDKLSWFIYNNFISKPLQYFFPINCGGGGVIVKRKLHNQIRGYDETLLTNNDNDYVRRAGKVGKFRMLIKQKAKFNVRRFDKEGRFKTHLKWWIQSVYYILGIHTKHVPFSYDYGKY